MEASAVRRGAGPKGGAIGDAAGPGLSARERERYARHLLLPGVGIEGQQRLAAARVVVVGAGGLGSPVVTYLAAAGVGTIGLVDDDTVDVTNLQRQVIHGTADLGRPKVDSAADRIADLNPHVRIERHPVRLTAATARELLTAYDVVVDATDNFPARYLLSDACVLVGRPLVWGAVARFDGQVSIWWPGRGPCYRCVFPRPPAPGLVPSCAEGGVFGVLPGVVGTLQATEVLKILLGVGEPLVGRMLVYDALAARMGTVPVAARPDCAACAPGAEPALVDLDEACSADEVPGGLAHDVPGGVARDEPGGVVPRGGDRDGPVPQVSPARAADLLAGKGAPLLVDVREAAERAIVTLAAAEERWLPLGALREGAGLPGVAPDRDILVYCRSGVRSAEAVALLRRAGYVGAMNVAGGLLRWRSEVDPQLPTY